MEIKSLRGDARSMFPSLCSLMLSAQQRLVNCGGALGETLAIFSPPPPPNVTFDSAPKAAAWIKASYRLGLRQ